MKNIFTLGLALCICGVASAQSKHEQDRQAIKQMEGCYKVTFNFAETFSPNPDYVKHDNYKSWAYEYVKVIEDEPNHIALQHLLLVNEDKDPMVIKHWRQDWDYENTDFYMYQQYNMDKNGHEWKYIKKSPEEVKGQWTQKVYQVDDSPRYEGSATWVHYDGRHYWENTTNAPLPRREYSKRSDYNVTLRTNKQEITDYGWVHEQDNAKVSKTADGEKIIAYEKGWNTYERVEDNMCEIAENWWNKNNKVWINVRTAWKNRFNQKKDLNLLPKKGENLMYEEFFDLKEDATVKDAEKIITDFSY